MDDMAWSHLIEAGQPAVTKRSGIIRSIEDDAMAPLDLRNFLRFCRTFGKKRLCPGIVRDRILRGEDGEEGQVKPKQAGGAEAPDPPSDRDEAPAGVGEPQGIWPQKTVQHRPLGKILQIEENRQAPVLCAVLVSMTLQNRRRRNDARRHQDEASNTGRSLAEIGQHLVGTPAKANQVKLICYPAGKSEPGGEIIHEYLIAFGLARVIPVHAGTAPIDGQERKASLLKLGSELMKPEAMAHDAMNHDEKRPAGPPPP